MGLTEQQLGVVDSVLQDSIEEILGESTEVQGLNSLAWAVCPLTVSWPEALAYLRGKHGKELCGCFLPGAHQINIPDSIRSDRIALLQTLFTGDAQAVCVSCNCLPDSSAFLSFTI